MNEQTRVCTNVCSIKKMPPRTDKASELFPKPRGEGVLVDSDEGSPLNELRSVAGGPPCC